MPATCTEDGKTQGKHCRVCDYVEVQPTTLPAPGHIEVDDAGVPATCTEEGKTAGKHCEKCGTVTVEQQVIPAAGHSMTHNSAEAADFVTDGKKEHWSCSVCEKNFADEDGESEIEDITVPKIEHNYTETYVCTLCGTGTGTFGLQYEYDSDKDTYAVTGIGTASGDIVIPHYYNGKPVTAVGFDAFHACGEPWSTKPLTSVVIPDSVESIGSSAFDYCYDLTSIKISDSITIIDSLFDYCTSIESVIIPDGVETLGVHAFYYCSNLVSVTIPKSVTVIKYDSFTGCAALTDVYYAGTMAEWNALVNGVSWAYKAGNYTVHCSNGDIAKS